MVHPYRKNLVIQPVGELAPALGEGIHLLCGVSERVRRKYGEVGTERHAQQGGVGLSSRGRERGYSGIWGQG